MTQTDAQAAGKVWPSARWVGYQERRGLAGHRVVDRHDREIRRMERIESWGWNGWHVLTYTATLTAFVAPAMHRGWRLGVLLAVSAATHGFIDRRWPVRWLLEHTGSAAFAHTPWGPMAVDQALHLSILCLLVAWLA